MSQGETWTTRRLLEWTTTFFTEKGAESPRLEAEILLAHALKTTRVNLYVNYDSVPNDEIANLSANKDFFVEGQLGTYYVSFNVNNIRIFKYSDNMAYSVNLSYV